MTSIVSEIVTTTALVAAYTAAAASHKFTPGSLIHVKNAGGPSCNVTMVTPAVYDGNAVADKVNAVAGGAEAFIWVSTDPIYRGSDGLVEVTFSVTADVTVAAVRPTKLN